jgi:hypothetical protein
MIWFAMLSGMGVILFLVGGGWPSGEDEAVFLADPVFLIGLGSFVLSLIIRGAVVPRLRGQSLISAAVFGMALGELGLLLAVFVLPDEAVFSQQLLIVLAFLGVASFAPIYARA